MDRENNMGIDLRREAGGARWRWGKGKKWEQL